jgi:hypothetical protein
VRDLLLYDIQDRTLKFKGGKKMKNWWKNLRPANKSRLEVVLGLILFLAVIIWLNLLVTYIGFTRDRIIFDSARQEIRQELSFTAWLSDWLGPEKYLFISEEFSDIDIVVNVAYRAKFRLPKNSQSIKNFLTEEMFSPDESYADLKKAVSMCISKISRQNFNIEGYPSITVRAMSIGNMNELCPIASRFGYEWSDKLEIVQCNGNLPLDNARKNDCLNSARFAHYP